jgi:hypothetical protein
VNYILDGIVLTSILYVVSAKRLFAIENKGKRYQLYLLVVFFLLIIRLLISNQSTVMSLTQDRFLKGAQAKWVKDGLND